MVPGSLAAFVMLDAFHLDHFCPQPIMLYSLSHTFLIFFSTIPLQNQTREEINLPFNKNVDKLI